LTSPFEVIAQMWLALFLGSLQMVLERPSNAGHVVLEHYMTWPGRGCQGFKGGVCNIPVPYWEEMNSSHRVSSL
jgi:hypothetical protein